MFQHSLQEISKINSDNTSFITNSKSASDSLMRFMKKLAMIARYDGRSRYTDLVILVVIFELYFQEIIITAIFMWLWAGVNLLYFFYTLNLSIRHPHVD